MHIIYRHILGLDEREIVYLVLKTLKKTATLVDESAAAAAAAQITQMSVSDIVRHVPRVYIRTHNMYNIIIVHYASIVTQARASVYDNRFSILKYTLLIIRFL